MRVKVWVNVRYQEALRDIYSFPRSKNGLLAISRGPMEATCPLRELICVKRVLDFD